MLCAANCPRNSDCLYPTRDRREPTSVSKFVDKVIEDLPIFSPSSANQSLLTRTDSSNLRDVLRSRGLLTVPPTRDSPSEVEVRFYSEHTKRGKPVKFFTSSHHFKNGRLVYSATEESIPGVRTGVQKYRRGDTAQSQHRGLQRSLCAAREALRTKSQPCGRKAHITSPRKTHQRPSHRSTSFKPLPNKQWHQRTSSTSRAVHSSETGSSSELSVSSVESRKHVSPHRTTREFERRDLQYATAKRPRERPDLFVIPPHTCRKTGSSRTSGWSEIGRFVQSPEFRTYVRELDKPEDTRRTCGTGRRFPVRARSSGQLQDGYAHPGSSSVEGATTRRGRSEGSLSQKRSEQSRWVPFNRGHASRILSPRHTSTADLESVQGLSPGEPFGHTKERCRHKGYDSESSDSDSTVYYSLPSESRTSLPSNNPKDGRVPQIIGYFENKLAEDQQQTRKNTMEPSQHYRADDLLRTQSRTVHFKDPDRCPCCTDSTVHKPTRKGLESIVNQDALRGFRDRVAALDKRRRRDFGDGQYRTVRLESWVSRKVVEATGRDDRCEACRIERLQGIVD